MCKPQGWERIWHERWSVFLELCIRWEHHMNRKEMGADHAEPHVLWVETFKDHPGYWMENVLWLSCRGRVGHSWVYIEGNKLNCKTFRKTWQTFWWVGWVEWFPGDNRTVFWERGKATSRKASSTGVNTLCVLNPGASLCVLLPKESLDVLTTKEGQKGQMEIKILLKKQ